MRTMIQLQGVQKQFAEQTVLKDLTLQIHAGELVGLVGVNGAGKTTLINLLLGLLPATAGKVEILGEQPTAANHRQIMGVMFQHDISINRLQVREMLTLQQAYFKEPLPIDQLLELADLTKFAKKKVQQLSGGQRRRLSFALAMAGNPELLFLDEPTAGMDVTSRAAFWRIIEKLKSEGKTIIVTSHYLEEIESLATRILFLQAGHFIFDGSLAALQAKYGKTQFRFDSDLSAATIQAATGITDFDYQAPSYCLRTGNSDATLLALKDYLTVIHHLTIQPSSLTQIFTTLTKQVTPHA